MSNDYVILVNESDQETGVMEKLEAHQKGLLHRAFSVLVMNNRGEILLQRRAFKKYHSAGLWTNTCCSHPKPGETTLEAASRRLKEEMGFVCELTINQHIIYKVEFPNGLIEHELDYIITGKYNLDPAINPEEVAEWKWISPEQLRLEIENNPQDFTHWFKLILDKYPLTVR